MTPAYRVSLPARSDLRAIWSYIARDNLVAADRLLDRFEAKFAITARQPLIGAECRELGADLRSVVVGKYMVFYRVLREDSLVEIVRVIHGARDIGHLFGA